MNNLLVNNSITQMELQYSVPLVLCVSFSCIIYRYIVRRFLDNPGDEPNLGGTVRVLTGEETIGVLNDLGLGYLTTSGWFVTLILAYLWHLGNFAEVINLNFNTLDPNVLNLMLTNLRFIITNHELIFNVLSNFVRMYEDIDLDFDYDPEQLEILFRNAGNELFRLYRAIERELNLDHTDLPEHWSE